MRPLTQLKPALMVVAASALLALAPSLARAQAPIFDVKAATHIRDKYLTDLDSLHAKFVALANAIPADKYTWRPSPDVRTVAQVFMHVAGEWLYYDPKSVGGNPPADFGVPKDALAKLETISDKATVLTEMDKAWKYGRAQVAGVDPTTLTGTIKPWGLTIDEAAITFPADLHEHLGQLIAYARAVGVKPPWSK